MPQTPGQPEAASRSGAQAIAAGRWLAGSLAAWCLFWLVIGSGTMLQLHRQPHPWVLASSSEPVLLHALLEWALSALAAYAAAGLLISGAVLPLLRPGGDGAHFRRGLVLGLGTVSWCHGILYAWVPTGMTSLPGLNHLPSGVLLLGFLGGGMALAWRGLAPRAARVRLKLLVPLFTTLALLPFLPHDLARHGPGGAALDRTRPRLILVSFDALRRDTFDQAMPLWKLPPGIQTVTAFPATRLAWETILGADPDRTFRTSMVPPLWEATHPEHLKLLVQARRAGLRTAYAINDSLSPCFGLQPTLFNTVLEPAGGWKYWLSYGNGTCWPLFSWLQNYASPIETSNPWNDTGAWFRDLGRLLGDHDWVSSHNCLLHPPIRLTLGEIQSFDPWRWLLHSPLAYLSYESLNDQIEDRLGWRETWRSDGKRQYEVRAARLLAQTAPFLDSWARDFPNLSGLVLSDHGEGFPVFPQDTAKPATHGSGIHGFGLNALTMNIPLHPFGVTRNQLAGQDVWSLLDLRDAIGDWMRGRQPLALKGDPRGWCIQMHTIVPTHLMPAQPGVPAGQGLGLRPEEIAAHIRLLPSGNWYSADSLDPAGARTPVSTGLVGGGSIVLFNPAAPGQFFRQEILGGAPRAVQVVSAEAYEQEVRAFPGRRVVSDAFR